MNTETIPYFEDKVDKIDPSKPTVERNVVHVIVYNRKADEVLCLDWPKFNWKTFIIGGIDDDEEPVTTANREVLEETGYKNIKFISEVGKTKSGFFAKHKNENRIANATGLLFELINDEKVETKESETQNHTFKWLPKSEVASYVNLDNQKYIWENAIKTISQTN